eukprot:6944612-Prymnesium_polylepis.2
MKRCEAEYLLVCSFRASPRCDVCGGVLVAGLTNSEMCPVVCSFCFALCQNTDFSIRRMPYMMYADLGRVRRHIFWRCRAVSVFASRDESSVCAPHTAYTIQG